MINRLANRGWLAYICQQYMKQEVLIVFLKVVLDLLLTFVTTDSIRLVVAALDHLYRLEGWRREVIGEMDLICISRPSLELVFGWFKLQSVPV
jgi:hypothetical protein